jgi:hypothetical protein
MYRIEFIGKISETVRRKVIEGKEESGKVRKSQGGD